MKGGNVQINWHDNKPVLTLDFHPILGTLATGGADLDIKENNLLLVQMWSIDGAYLISGLVDNSCIIWDVNKGSVHQILDSHCHYVQGMAWVPLVNYVASLSSDKTCRIYVKKPQYVSQHAISKAPLSDDSKFTKNHLFLDETLPSFFRRLAWLPHGSFLLVPAAGFFNLPYCIIFVVATLNSLYIYETESVPPIAIFAGFHYAAITDIAWSPDADCLALSSQDGYRTLIEFENDELGSPIYLTEEKKVMGDEKRSPVHKPQGMVFEAAKNNSLIEKAENVPTEAMAANNLITIDGVKSKAECNQLTEAETKGKEVGGEENESPVEKLDDMVLDSIVAEKIGKSEAERNEGKNELPIISKPTKRCITLMEFDP